MTMFVDHDGRCAVIWLTHLDLESSLITCRLRELGKFSMTSAGAIIRGSAESRTNDITASSIPFHNNWMAGRLQLRCTFHVVSRCVCQIRVPNEHARVESRLSSRLDWLPVALAFTSVAMGHHHLRWIASSHWHVSILPPKVRSSDCFITIVNLPPIY